MISAVQSALSGLRTASQRFDQAATDIVRAGARSAETVVPSAQGGEQNTPATTRPVSVGFDPTAFADERSPSLTDGLLALKEAEVLYKASAKVLGSLQRLEGEFLNINR